MTIKHLDPTVEVKLTMLGGEDDPRLEFRALGLRDADDQNRRIPSQLIHTMNLRVWPGLDVARTFLACSWATWFQHEALEHCYVDGVRMWDPHRPPFIYDHGFRAGMPVDVEMTAIYRTLTVVVGLEAARRALHVWGS